MGGARPIILLGLFTPLLWTACEGEGPPPAPPSKNDLKGAVCKGASKAVEVEEETEPQVQCPQGERRVLCVGSWAAQCDASGTLVSMDNCRSQDLVCAPQVCDDADDCKGCARCLPGSARCGADGELSLCRADGSGYAPSETCDEAAGEYCSLASARCENLCEVAEQQQSYIGCEYWAVPSINRELGISEVDTDGICRPFYLALVIANAEGVDATVTIDSPGHERRTVRVSPGETETVPLPCDLDLRLGLALSELVDDGTPPREVDRELLRPRSMAKRDAAHHVVSNVPVTVYQFNPLEFWEEASAERGDQYSYTNDASLLLPVHTLTGNYRVISQPTMMSEEESDGSTSGLFSKPGFVSIVGVEDAPTTVEITSSAHTEPSMDGSIPALRPGQSHTLTLEKGQIVQLLTAAPDECEPGPVDDSRGGADLIYCDVGPDYDLTGTQVRANGKVAVLSGHDCTFLPYFRWACDHLEETMFPVESWGKEIPISLSEPVNCAEPLPNMIRVLSDADGNDLRFVPEVHEPVTLNAGDYLEFETTRDFRVIGSEAILVSQFLLGQDYKGIGAAGGRAKGDPAMSLGIPTEQWRKQYSFLAPSTITNNFVNITAQEGQIVVLDGRVIERFTPIEETGLVTARIPVEPGQHSIESASLFGIVVYGYATYTSYMVPGGLDLNPINRPD